MKKDRIVITAALGFIFSIMAYVGMIATAWGHFPSGRSYYLYMAFAWPLHVTAAVLPNNINPLIPYTLGLILHFAFYTFIAWLLVAAVRKLWSVAP